jgi:ABC-type dipeptide/oligopeptide/nickel transport system permease subunit
VTGALALVTLMLIVCLGFNLLGDGIRDIIDPKMRR